MIGDPATCSARPGRYHQLTQRRPGAHRGVIPPLLNPPAGGDPLGPSPFRDGVRRGDLATPPRCGLKPEVPALPKPHAFNGCRCAMAWRNQTFPNILSDPWRSRFPTTTDGKHWFSAASVLTRRASLLDAFITERQKSSVPARWRCSPGQTTVRSSLVGVPRRINLAADAAPFPCQSGGAFQLYWSFEAGWCSGSPGLLDGMVLLQQAVVDSTAPGRRATSLAWRDRLRRAVFATL